MEEPDEDIQQMFTLEHDELVSQLDHMLRHDLPAALLPPPVTSYLPAIVSINAGVGGAEASLCVADLSRMYTRYAERQNWKMEIVSQTEGPSDRGDKGIKEITFKIQGSQDQEVYGMLQWEKGVHRIQRVPVTDMSGRIHTSTITVVVGDPFTVAADHSGASDISGRSRCPLGRPQGRQDRSHAVSRSWRAGLSSGTSMGS